MMTTPFTSNTLRNVSILVDDQTALLPATLAALLAQGAPATPTTLEIVSLAPARPPMSDEVAEDGEEDEEEDEDEDEDDDEDDEEEEEDDEEYDDDEEGDEDEEDEEEEEDEDEKD